MNVLMFVPWAHVGDHPEEVPALVALLTLLTTVAKLLWDRRKEKKVKLVDDQDLRRVEKKMESHEDSSLTNASKPNPGRKMIDLLEVIHDEQKEFKKATNSRLDKLTEDVGYLKGRIDGQNRGG